MNDEIKNNNDEIKCYNSEFKISDGIYIWIQHNNNDEVCRL